MTETITLKNGAEEVKPFVAVTIMALNRLFDEQPLALYDLLELAKDPGYPVFEASRKRLREDMLLSGDGKLDDSTRNVVLSAVSFDSDKIKISSPAA